MARLKNRNTGVVVTVADDKPARLGREWELIDQPADRGVDLDGGYDGLTVAELRDEIDARNAERGDDDQLPRPSRKAELVEVLTADDEEELAEQTEDDVDDQVEDDAGDDVDE